MDANLENNKITQLLEIIDRNRWEQIRRLASPDSGRLQGFNENEELSASDVKIVLFAAETAFSDSIVKMFSDETVIAAFNDPEKTINFSCDNSIYNIVLDIDPPSNFHHALDVFNALKIINQKIQFFICTKYQKSQEKDYFELQGSTIFVKPVFRKQVKWMANHLVKGQQSFFNI